MRYPLLVFDWDGTIMDSIPRIIQVAQAAFEAVGFEPIGPERIRPFIGLNVFDFIDRLMPEFDKEAQKTFFLAYRELWRSERFAMAEPFEGVLQSLESLHQAGYRLAVATGKSRAGLDREMHYHQMGWLFEKTCCADETKAKPDPTMLWDVLRHCVVDAEASLVIGDSRFDIQMARNAGVHSVGVTTGCLSQSELSGLGANHVLESVNHLQAWLQDK